MNMRNYEIIHLRKNDIQINYNDNEYTVFWNYLVSRILDISENKEGKYSKKAVKQALSLKKAIISPKLGKKFIQELRERGHKI